jgi:hypothetical protein
MSMHSRRFLSPRLVASTFVLAATCGVIACAAPIDRGSEDGDDVEGQLIGGVPVTGKALDAVGALVVIHSNPGPDAGDYYCKSNDECAPGSECIQGTCWAGAGGDAGAWDGGGSWGDAGGWEDAEPHDDAGPAEETGVGDGGGAFEGGMGDGGLGDGGWVKRPAIKATKINAQYSQFCTATLIGKSTVVTAKHCVQGLEGYKIAFVTGPDAANPRAVYEIVGTSVESTITGGAGGIGADIAVARLDRPVEGIEPIEIGTLAKSDLKKTFAVVG